ncbi:hypothetical protein HYH03_005154 [Edaphochlamys debaryana]|uniref:Uncharacterized protein n=1 Tax=Edaphochlamys debaryana TaxID=47281 RepID=A0A835YDD4_9CHLO|nr:hypothetical protein HYH03_005154 [Edaphochlamys debaryana]|eukprot:KAG2496745.1 hypothetical protein HYH03_005154 [Edaphochlamys debaryana]
MLRAASAAPSPSPAAAQNPTPGRASGFGLGSMTLSPGLRAGVELGARGQDAASPAPSQAQADARREAGAAAGSRGASAGGEAADAGQAGGLRRAEISLTPSVARPRFNPADATTIIGFGGSDDEEDGGEAEGRAEEDYDGRVEPASPPGRRQHSPGVDPLTAAFEAALLGRGAGRMEAGAGAGGAGALRSAPFAWSVASPGANATLVAADDVERRLRALEAALASGSGRGTGGGGGATALLVEEVADVRGELRKVQQDNSRLRQELSTFSAHASALLTQMQAQLQQLLRGGVAAASAPSSSGGAANAFPSAPVAEPTQPYLSQLAPQPSSSRLGAAPPSFSAGLGLAAFESQPQTQPQAQAAALGQGLGQVQAPGLLQQTVARRSIFSDIDVASLRASVLPGAGTSGRADGGSGAAGFGAADAAISGGGLGTERSGYGALGGAGGRLTAVMTATSAGPSAAAGGAAGWGLQGASGTPRAVPVNSVEADEVELPSFAAFKRSAGAAAFTAATPHLSPAPAAGPGHSTGGAGAPDAAGPSPHSGTRVVPARSFPTSYQPRSLGGPIPRTQPSTAVGGVAPGNAALLGGSAAAAAASVAASGAYVSALAANAAAVAATGGSDAAAASLAWAHSGLPQPLVFSVAPEFRTARASGASADNSMSLSAHTAHAASLRHRASGVGR